MIFRQFRFTGFAPPLRLLPRSAFLSAAVLSTALLGLACSSPDANGEEEEPVDEEEQPLESCTDETKLCTWAGTGEAGFDGDGRAPRRSMLYWPVDLTFASNGDAYILDWNNHAVRLVNEDNELQTVVGSGFVGDGPDDLSDTAPPGADGTLVTLNHPTQLVELPSGKMLLVAWHNHKLREYDPETGMVVVTCGGPAGFAGDGLPARTASLNQPTQVVIAEDGSRFILDMRNQVVRKIDAEGIMSTVAGTPKMKGFAGDGGPPLAAMFEFPSGSNPPPGGALALAEDGSLYVADTLNHRIRRIDFEADMIETVAGTGEAGFSGDEGPGTEAQLNNPRDLELSPDGSRLYIADELNNRVRVLDLASGEIDTVAGTGERDYNGEGLAPTKAALARPSGLEFGADGMLYIADTYNNRIRTFKAEN